MKRWVVAVDIGATSGRVMVAGVGADALRLDGGAPLPQRRRARTTTGRCAGTSSGSAREVLVGLRQAAPSRPGRRHRHRHLGGRLRPARRGRAAARASRTPTATAAPTASARRSSAELGESTLYDVTGLQHLPFNTLYQLVAERDSEDYADADTLLLLPDLLAYWLTGRPRRRAHQRLDHAAARRHRPGTWALPRCSSGSACRTDLLPALVEPGTVIGTLRAEVAAEVGPAAGTPVIAVGSHDTASAVVGVPTTSRRPRTSPPAPGRWSGSSWTHRCSPRRPGRQLHQRGRRGRTVRFLRT